MANFFARFARENCFLPGPTYGPTNLSRPGTPLIFPLLYRQREREREREGGEVERERERGGIVYVITVRGSYSTVCFEIAL